MNAIATQEAQSMGLITAVLQSEHTPTLFGGEGTHEPALRLVGQIVPFTQDPERITSLVRAALPEDYSGDTLKEVPQMVNSAIEKGFHKSKPKKPGKETISAETAKLVTECGFTLFRDSQQRGYASKRTPEGGALNYPLDGEHAKLLVQKLFYDANGKPLGNHALNDTLGLLKARAIFDGELHDTALRIGRSGNAIYEDLGRSDGLVVRIDPKGWTKTYQCPVKFVRTTGFGALPEPETGGSLESLKTLLQLCDDNFALLLSFLLLCLRPGPTFMPLLVEGQQGSGKSFLCEIAKRIIDPNTALRARLPDTERDLMVLANATYLPTFDNASWVGNRTSDALCTLATGGGFITRKLRTDDELTMFSMSRPFIINGIGEFANRTDLLERAIPLQLPAIDENERKTEDKLRRDFEAMLPGIAGVLYDIVAVALAHEADAVPPTGIRMADCAKWLVAAQQSEALKSYNLLTCLADAQNEFSLDRVISNYLTAGLLDLIETGPVEGTARELRESMMGRGHANRGTYFPKSASKFSSELKRLQPDLKKAGIFVEFGQRTNYRRPIRIWREGQEGTTSTAPERKF